MWYRRRHICVVLLCLVSFCWRVCMAIYTHERNVNVCVHGILHTRTQRETITTSHKEKVTAVGANVLPQEIVKI